jgi:enoyl-CoA hydratase/carnithine racemase
MGSSDDGPVLLEAREEGVLTLTLNRPQRRNALDAALREALADAFQRTAADAATRAVVLTGAGGAFCAGADLAGFDEARASRRLTELMGAVESLEKPVVAAIDGVATGAGLALALACDWRVGSPRARILFREGRLGLVPSHGGLTRMVKLVGLARAKEALLGGDDLDAQAAREAGLLSEIADDAVVAAQARAHRMLARAPLSFAAAKRLLALAADLDHRRSIAAEGLAQAALRASEDHREGLAAARERREPVFRGN